VDPQAWTLLAFAVACLVLIVLGLARLGLEGRRLQKRVNALIERPMPFDFTRATDDLMRLTRSIERLSALAARALAAIARIRAQVAVLNRILRGFPGPA